MLSAPLPPMLSAQEITRNAKSNLAFALGILPRRQRRDMVVFYAYCRTIDDLADDEGLGVDERALALKTWRRGLDHGFADPTPLQRELIELRDRHEIPNSLLGAIIDGCEMDLRKARYQTWEELDAYIWKVACSVGLVSIRLFGCHSPESANYAEALGRALQLTNILRDVGEDLHLRDRIYLPLEDLRQFGYNEQELTAQVHDERFRKLMDFEACRAFNWFDEASLNLTRSDRQALRPARIMADIYRQVLCKMRRDGFRVFDRRYRIHNMHKLLIFIRHLMT